jgi:CheY-like chemotaxis protein
MNTVTVLVVDDDPLMYELYQMMLQSRGYAVLIANSGAQAIHLLEGKNLPDLILLDLMMPHMNGLEALAKIKAIPAAAQVPVVIFSNLMDVNAQSEAVRLGAARCTLKSEFSSAKLHALIQDVLGGPKPLEQPQS